jgi:hypothetical protein
MMPWPVLAPGREHSCDFCLPGWNLSWDVPAARPGTYFFKRISMSVQLKLTMLHIYRTCRGCRAVRAREEMSECSSCGEFFCAHCECACPVYKEEAGD